MAAEIAQKPRRAIGAPAGVSSDRPKVEEHQTGDQEPTRRVRAITIRQPWATLIVQGRKTLEIRTWRTNHRGLLLIHAGTSRVDLTAARASPWSAEIPPDSDLVFGAIIGDARLVSVAPAAFLNPLANDRACIHIPSDAYAWELTDSRPRAPTPCKGRLGLWWTEISE